MKKLLTVLALLTSISTFAVESFESVFTPANLPSITRDKELTYLREFIWESRPHLRQRSSALSETNFFHSNNYSFNEDALSSLLEDYREFFIKHKVDVDIDDRYLSQELLLQVEALATYIEDLLIMPRKKDYLDRLLYLNSSANLFGGLIINHRFKIKRGRKSEIKFSQEDNKPTVTIFYNEFIKSALLKEAKKEPTLASETRAFGHYGDMGDNIARYLLKYTFAGNKGLIIDSTTEMGFYKNNKRDIQHIFSFNNFRLREETFITPRKIDVAITAKYFKRICNGLGIAYTPSELFLLFPQAGMLKFKDKNGNLKYYSPANESVVFRPDELNDRMKRDYPFLIKENCTQEETSLYELGESTVDPGTGLNPKFIKYVSQISMAHRFQTFSSNPLSIKEVLELLICPAGKVCSRRQKIRDQGSPSL